MDRRLDSLKTLSKKIVHKASEFLKNKIADTGTKSNDEKLVKQEPVEEITTTRKKRWNIKEIEKNIIKMEQYKISELLTIQLHRNLRQENGSKKIIYHAANILLTKI